MDRIIQRKERKMILQRAFFSYITIAVCLVLDVKVAAYYSGCNGGYCFVISTFNDSNERLDRLAAQQQCQFNRTQLIEITNKDIQDSLVNFIKRVYSQGLGGWNVLTNAIRSSTGWLHLNGYGIGFLAVYEQPVISLAYVYLRSTTSGFDLFASKPNDNKEGFMCSGFSDCSGGVTLSGQCYKSYTETLSWYDARNRCLDRGGDLASFDYITTNAEFNALNGSWINTSNRYWIGVRRESWKWQYSSLDVKYSHWMTGHPINDQSNSDCLCLSTTELKWIECGCTQQLPFVCMSDNSLTTSSTTASTKASTTTSTSTSSTTTRSTSSTSMSTTITPSATVAPSSATSRIASESQGVSMPTIPATVTSNSTPATNDSESLEQSMGLSREAQIGIGVGVGVGGAVVIIALIVVFIVLCRKRFPLRCPQKKKTDAKLRSPHAQTPDSTRNEQSNDGFENPYAFIVPSSPKLNTGNTDTLGNSNQTPAVYAELGFCRERKLQSDGRVVIVPGKGKPSPPPKPQAIKTVNDAYAEATTA